MAIPKLYDKSGDDQAKEIQQDVEKKFGFVPEAFQAMGRKGAFLKAMMDLDGAAGQGVIDEKTKQLICVAVASVNGCVYCVDAHSAMAKEAGVSDEEISGALEVASMMSAFNMFLKSIDLNRDIQA